MGYNKNIFFHGGINEEHNFSKQLVDKTGHAQQIEPISITWSNGFCYLLAKNKYNADTEDMTAYRIDRIKDIEPTDLPIIHYPENFDPIAYQKQHPVMHAGKLEKIHMLCNDTNDYPLANLLMDTFGRSFRAKEASDEILQTYLHDTKSNLLSSGQHWYTVTVTSSRSGTKQWAKQHTDKVIITSPQNLVSEIKAELTIGLSHYNI